MAKQKTAPVSEKRKPRLLWANPFCLLDTSSGASMTVRQMLLQLVASGYEVQILGATVFDNPKGMGLLKEQFPDLSTPLHQLIEAEDGPLTHQLVVSYSHNRNHFTTHEEGLWYSQYLYLLDSFKPDIVWFYGGQTVDMLIADEARDRGVPVAFYLANGHYKSPRWCRDIDLILTDSQATADMYRKDVGFAAKPVGKFIAADRFIAKEHERKRLLFVNPSWQKGASVFVQLAEKLERERPDIELEVVEARADWTSVLRETTHRMGQQRNSLSNVTVTANTADMRGPYSRARVLAAPSLWWESSGRVLAEAMLNGIPALITNRGGMPEMVGEAGIAFDFPAQCYEEPYQQLLSEEELQPLFDAAVAFFDDEALYQDYVARAFSVGEEKHHINRATERLLDALTPLARDRAGNKDFSISQKKRHRQRLPSVANKPELKVDRSLEQLLTNKAGSGEEGVSKVPRLHLTEDFTWQFKGKIIVLDNRASLIKSGLADQMAATSAFGIVAFDPASEVKNAKQYEGSDTIQIFQHALLGDGNAATLNACVAPEMTSTLKPMPAEQLPERHHLGTQLLAELPINSVALDSITGLESLDWLILDELSDAMAVLENGKEALEHTLLIQARIPFQLTHEKQPSLAELQHWAIRNGFRFYRFHNIRHYSHLPEKLNERSPCASEQESADVLFIPNHQRMAALTDDRKNKLAFILSAGFAAHDMAFELMADSGQDNAMGFLESLGFLPKQNSDDDQKAKASLEKNEIKTEEASAENDNAIALSQKDGVKPNGRSVERDLNRVLKKIKKIDFNENLASDVVKLADDLVVVEGQRVINEIVKKIEVSFKEKPDSIPLFYLLTNALMNADAPVAEGKLSTIVEKRLESIGWSAKSRLYSWWVSNVEYKSEEYAESSISVVVICNKYKQETRDNLIELCRQTRGIGDVVFVNNGDRSQEIARLKDYADVFIELKGNSGAYLARNIGAAFSNGNVIAFIDDDGLPEPGMINAHLEAHSNYTLDSVRGSYLPKNKDETPPPHYHLGEKPVVAINSLEGNCSYRKDIFLKMGGWGDYILFGHGGPELYVRMIEQGSKNHNHVYIPNCILRHNYFRGEKHAVSKKRKQAESAFILYARDKKIAPMVSGFLKKNENLDKDIKVSSYSQYGEDLAIAEILKPENRSGVYVDVGAFHPTKYSNTALLHSYGWCGINVDASEASISLFEKARPEDINICCVVSEQYGYLTFYESQRGTVSTLSKKHRDKWMSRGEPYKEVRVKSKKLVEIFSCLNGRRIDYLNIDVEDAEMGVLLSNDWSEFKPSLITIEVHDLDVSDIEKNEVCEFLLDKGYEFNRYVKPTAFFILKV
ncbi:FkbM family methyltransferase [Vreelandella sp. TE19]